jgi:hypothetical protein
MGNRDPKSYYKALGVQPDAPPSVIKAAYRALAMDLHPDRNSDQDATAKFQRIQEAYATLSDAKLREQYDADSAVPSTGAAPGDGKRRPLEPIVCSRCNAISAQPRFKVFHVVYGYIVGATKSPRQGVLCSKCEIKVGLQASAITLVAGWWSIHGFFWTLQTLVENLVGGQFHQQDAQLHGYQAMYFAQNGKLDLARALAVEALKIAEKATKQNNRRQAPKAKLGYDSVDSLKELKKSLTDFINSLPADTKVVELRSTSGIFNKRFAFQVLLLLAVTGSLVGEWYRQERAGAEAERVRLVQVGIERKRAAEIAQRNAEALRKMERPLPQSGILRFADRGNFDPDRNPPLKITNAPDANTLMKLTRVGDGVEIMSIFIRAGQTIEVAVPFGSYKVKIASGKTWYGDAVRFGPNTSYAILDAVLDFRREGSQLMGHQLALTRVRGGNLKQLPLMAKDF